MAREVTATWVRRYETVVTVGGHQVTLDALPEDGGGDTGPSPGELLLGALGA